MQNHFSKDSQQSFVYSATNGGVARPSWWTSNELNVTQSSFSNNWSLNMNPNHGNPQTKQTSRKVRNQESSSTQSTGQSLQEVVNSGDPEQSISAQSGYADSKMKAVDNNLKPVQSVGNPETLHPNLKNDYGPSVTCMPYPYAEPYMGGILAAYGPHTIIHPQMAGIGLSTRVPLPLEVTENEPIYVNAKQYHAILRRRQARAKLEAQLKQTKGRKSYLHESRHLHAMKRVRGAGGRFLNTKHLQQQQQQQQQYLHNSSSTPTTDGNEVSGGSMLQLGGIWNLSESDAFQSDNGNFVASAGTSGSDITSNSNSSSMFQVQNMMQFAEHRSEIGREHRGSNQHSPFTR